MRRCKTSGSMMKRMTAKKSRSATIACIQQNCRAANRSHKSARHVIQKPLAPASSTQKLVCGATRPSKWRSEEHTSELQSLMRISYAVFCLKQKNHPHTDNSETQSTRHNRQPKAESTH